MWEFLFSFSYRILQIQFVIAFVHSLILWQEGHFTREIKNLEEEEGEQEEECNIQGGPKKYAHTK